MHLPNIGDIGHLLEGTVEQNPLDGTYFLRLQKDDGSVSILKLSSILDPYLGQEVRLTLASIEAIDRLTKILGEGIL